MPLDFKLAERPPGWAQRAPIQIHHDVALPASPEDVFAVLSDNPGWTRWFKGMRKVRIDGADHGVGALRTVWVGPTRVQEHFIVWDPPKQITFHIVKSNSPGLRVMVEDYQITPTPDGAMLGVTVGVDAHWPLRLVPDLVRYVVGRPTSGVLGITSVFPRT